MTNVRSFNGTSDYLTFTQGVAPTNLSGNFSIVAVVRGHDINSAGVIMTMFGSGGQYWWFYLNSSRIKLYDGVGSPDNGANLLADKFYVVGANKASGTTTPRFHWINLTDSGSWNHANGSSTVGSGSSAVSPSVYVGKDNGSPHYLSTDSNGGLLTVAFWTSNLSSDSTWAGFTSLTAINAASPSAMLVFNQASTATSVSDYVDSVNQSAINGTTVNSVTIPNFDATWPPGGGPTFIPQAINY